MKKIGLLIIVILFLVACLFFISREIDLNPRYKVGQKIDNLNGVSVYYNGPVKNISGRNVTNDGYNLGMKYQCVEFVKRYYFEFLDHKMPNSYGNAKDFFESNLKDGEVSIQRNLIQYTNGSKSKPRINDLVVYSGNIVNEYGHVSIISKVNESEIQIIQQNSGPFSKSRESYTIKRVDGKWYIDNHKILGWLRKHSITSK